MEWGKGRREKYSFKFLEWLKHVLGSESWVKASCPFHHRNEDVWHRYGDSSDLWKWLRQRINSAWNLAHVEDWAMQVLHSRANENWTSQNLSPSVWAGHLCPSLVWVSLPLQQGSKTPPTMQQREICWARLLEDQDFFFFLAGGVDWPERTF